MKKIIFSVFIASSLLIAGPNHSEFVNVSWTAFKTFKKIGVGGMFKNLTFTPKNSKSKDLHTLLLGAKISIASSEVYTNNPGRDKEIARSFFAVMKGKTIEGEIVKTIDDTPTSGTFIAKITMNGQDVLIPMVYRYETKQQELVAKGTIDIFDFSGQDALSTINKACFDLHRGKTWNDVDIEFRLKIKGYVVKGVKGLFG